MGYPCLPAGVSSQLVSAVHYMDGCEAVSNGHTVPFPLGEKIKVYIKGLLLIMTTVIAAVNGKNKKKLVDISANNSQRV